MLYMLLVFCFIAVVSITWAFFAPSYAEFVMKQRIQTLRHSRGPVGFDSEEMQRPFAERVMKPLTDGLQKEAVRWTPKGVTNRAKLRLAQAGNPMAVGHYLGIKILVFILVASIFMMVMVAGSIGIRDLPILLVLGLLLSTLAAMMPDTWLKMKIAVRKKLVERALPNVMDLLCVSVEAGLGFDLAMQRVGEKFGPPIADEFGIYLKEVRLGKSRADGMRALASRIGIAEMQSLSTAIIQAEQLGLGLARVLRVQSDQMRTRRRQRAEERAMKTPIMMLFPLVFFIFPTIFLVILGPVAIQLMTFFNQ